MYHLFVAVSGHGISGKSSQCSSHDSSESGNASQHPSAVCGPASPQTTEEEEEEEEEQHLTGSSSHKQASKDLLTESLPASTGSGIKDTVKCETQSHKVPGKFESCKVATQPDPQDLSAARLKHCDGDGNTCTALPQRARDCVGGKTVLDKTLPQNTNNEAPSKTSCSTITSSGKETGASADREV